MTRCCPRLRMRWSGATDAIARCKSRSTGYARKRRSVPVLRSICGVKPRPKAVNKPSHHCIRHGLDKPGVFTTVSKKSTFTRRHEKLWVRTRGDCPFSRRSRWTQTWSYAAPKSYVAGPTQRHTALTHCIGCLQQANGKVISRKNEKLLDKRQLPGTPRHPPSQHLPHCRRQHCSHGERQEIAGHLSGTPEWLRRFYFSQA